MFIWLDELHAVATLIRLGCGPLTLLNDDPARRQPGKQFNDGL